METHKRSANRNPLPLAGTQHECRICGKSFEWRGFSHIRAHKGWTTKRYIETFFPLQCKVCGKAIPYLWKKYQYTKVKYCSNHCRELGRTRTKKERIGPLASGWKGGTFIMQGYRMRFIATLPDKLKLLAEVMRRENSGRIAKLYIQEHRLVLANKLGRPLERFEAAHHIDGNRLNNKPENLELRVLNHGPGATHITCPHCGKEYVL